MPDLPHIPTDVPASVLERRAVPRVSISDLNEMDLDALRDRLANTRRDDRPVVVKVLDLLDAPRNKIIANVFPSLEREARERGEIGTTGTGRVTGADILKSAGVDNRIVNGILGFGLDIATDPLTYLGPAGWGAQAGKTVITKGGQKAIRGGIRVAAERGLSGVGDDAVRNLIKAAGHSDETLAALRAGGKTTEQIASELDKAVRGTDTTGRIGGAFARVGGERASQGGALGKAFESTVGKTPEEVEAIKASRAFGTQYGRGTGKALKIGLGPDEVGSEIAHVPFTDWTVQVPAFTPTAKQAAFAQGLYRDKRLGLDILKGIPEVGAAHAGLQTIREASDAALRGEPIDLAAIKQTAEDVRAVAGKQAVIAGLSDGKYGPDAMLAIGDMLNEAKAHAALAQRQMDLLEKVKEPGLANVLGPETVAEYINASPEAKDALAAANSASRDLARTLDGVVSQFSNSAQRDVAEAARVAVGANDASAGYSLTTPFASVAKDLFRSFGKTDEQLVMGAERAVDRLDRTKRLVFGVRKGEQPRRYAEIKSRMSDGAMVVNRDTTNKAVRDLRKIAGDFGLPPGAEADLREYATAKAAIEANRRAGNVTAQKIVENGQLVDGPLLNRLKAIEASKSLAGAKPGFGAALDNWVKATVDSIEAVRDAEVQDGVLDSVLPGYLMSGLTPQASRAARRQAKIPGFEHGAAIMPGTEGFQRPRTTMKVQFQSPKTGEWREFYRADVNALDKLGPQGLAQLDAGHPLHAIADAVDEYKAMEKPPAFMATDPFELNQRYAQGRFRHVTGSDPNVDKFFETDVATLLGNRMAQHTRAVARSDLQTMMAQSGLDLGDDLQNVLKNAQHIGTELETPNGIKVRVIDNVPTRDGGRSPILQIHGVNHRLLSPRTLSANDNAVVEAMGSKLSSMVFPEAVADTIDNLAAATSDPGTLLGHLQRATGIWKTSTLFHPSWIVSNVIGDFTNAVAGGAKPQTLTRLMPEMIAIRAAKDNPEKLAKISVRVGDRIFSGTELAEMFKRYRAWNDNAAAEVMYQIHQRGNYGLPSQRGVGAGLSEDMKFLTEAYRQPLQKFGKVGKVAAAGAAGARVGIDRLGRHIVGPFMHASGFVSDTMRASTMLAHMDEGADAGAAAERMIRSQFDYSDFSRIEDRYLRQIFPFLSWSRNNLAYQLQLLLERPAYAANFPRLKETLEDMIAGDEAVPEHMRPKWMQGQLALQIGADPSSRFAFMLGNTIPTADIYNVLAPAMGEEGAQHFLKYFVSMGNPVVSTPIQIGAGSEFFSGRTIGTDVNSDTTPSEFLARQLRPVSELGLGVDGKIPDAFSRGLGQGVARTVLGGRVQAFDEARLHSSKLADFKKEEEGLRRQVHKAERNGDKERSLASRVAMLHLYDEMARDGFEAEVPAWAKKQLGSLHAPQATGQPA